ncbi:calcium-transporting ATPase 4, endoplasmic reticulum-type [Hordeum vulgare]|nr:calcium-transporting ATPase 4, endoplasmic reticulum-type [Hordeum vulgare]
MTWFYSTTHGRLRGERAGGAARVVPQLRVVRCMAASDAAQLKSVREDIKEILKTTYCDSILSPSPRRRRHLLPVPAPLPIPTTSFEDRDRGLSSSEAAARRRAHGPNELLDHPGHSVLQLVAQQFEDTLVRIPLAVGAVSFALALSSSAGALTLSAFVEPLVIFLILVVNAAVGV